MNKITATARTDQLIDAVIEYAVAELSAGENQLEFNCPVVYEWTAPAPVTIEDVLIELHKRCGMTSPSLVLKAQENDVVGCSYCGKGVVNRSDPDWIQKARDHCTICEKHPIFQANQKISKLAKACQRAISALAAYGAPYCEAVKECRAAIEDAGGAA